jgi:uncharacterized membrane protein YhaH (DUF805 family)
LKDYNEPKGEIMMKEYVQAFKQYAEFSGRSGRRDYWMFILIHTIITIVVTLVAFIGIMIGILLVSGALWIAGVSYYGSLILLFVYYAATLIPSLAIATRRLHDIGYSGWYLLLLLIPIVGAIILLIFMIRGSQPGHNQYGPALS